MTKTFAVVDVHYPDTGGARAAAMLSSRADLATITTARTATLEHVAEYRPGNFYERELPAIAAVLDELPPIDVLVIDGYVDLDPDGRPGLGMHAWQEQLAPVVIGVAKTRFHSATHAAEVRRGTATSPLYVTSIGIDLADAADLVRGMSGGARVPDALRLVDRLARGKLEPSDVASSVG
ncbi:endonuclease V [Luteimicrobium sp. DT211]|uniref:endonuclease V n=1 Tax=Luteimicrobium sp. DT211 TaxID=3393412 RepID=UPI003CE95085